MCAYICFVRTKVRIYILGITVQIKIPKKKRRLVPKLYSPVLYIRTAPATPLDARALSRVQCTGLKQSS